MGWAFGLAVLLFVVPVAAPWPFDGAAGLLTVPRAAFDPAEWFGWVLGTGARGLGLSATVADLLQGGAAVTIRLTVRGALLGTVMALITGLAAFSSYAALRGAARSYTEFFRGTSAIVQLFWAFYGLPLIASALPEFIPERFVRLTPMEAGVIVLGLNMGAYGSEVVRSGIQAIGQGQREAAVALSLTPLQRMRYVILPQAVLVMLPPYGNLLIELLKGTALVGLLPIVDLLRASDLLRTNHTASSLTLYSTVLVMYFIIALMITGMVRFAERHYARGLDIGRGS